jgi:hypothetical protein
LPVMSGQPGSIGMLSSSEDLCASVVLPLASRPSKVARPSWQETEELDEASMCSDSLSRVHDCASDVSDPFFGMEGVIFSRMVGSAISVGADCVCDNAQGTSAADLLAGFQTNEKLPAPPTLRQYWSLDDSSTQGTDLASTSFLLDGRMSEPQTPRFCFAD